MAKKKLYDENGNEVKRRGGCLKWVGIIIIAIVALGLLGAVFGDEDTDISTSESQISSQAPSPSGKEVATEAAQSSTASVEEEPEESIETVDDQYQAILDDYTIKIQEAAPRLVEEYNNEFPSNQGGLEGLAELSNEKIGDLAEISNEGVGEMADVYYRSGSGKYEEYEEWAGKLMDIYMEEAGQITDAYMNSAQ